MPNEVQNEKFRAKKFNLTSGERYSHLEAQTALLQRKVLGHSLYSEVKTLAFLRAYMENHVFAVWDFMTLLKALQRKLTCVETPWLPTGNPIASRLVNEIVLAEESDEIGPGKYLSHFELYLEAMKEVGADTRPIQLLLKKIRGGKTVQAALADIPVYETTKNFVLATMRYSELGAHQLASVFLFSREGIIPTMFEKILGQLENENQVRCDFFRAYLNRHIELDGDHHGPMVGRLLESLWRE